MNEGEFIINGKSSELSLQRLDTNAYKPLVPINEQLQEYKDIINLIGKDPEATELDAGIGKVLIVSNFIK